MWIIDDRGVVRNLSELPRRLGATFGGIKLASYAVENLGFVVVGTRPRRTFIRLRPKLVGGSALTALWFWLQEHDDRPCSVRWLADDIWRDELMFGFSPTMRLIAALCESSVVSERDRARRFRKRCLAQDGSAFRVDLEEVRELVFRAPKSAWARQQLSLRFGGRWTLSELDTSNGQVIIRNMGEGYPLYDCAWTCQPLGRSFDEFPDPAYGRFVTKSHREAFESARPIHDEVDAHISWPRFGLLRTRYERLIAPYFSGSRALLLSASVARADTSVDF
jgi:hypothetical protein